MKFNKISSTSLKYVCVKVKEREKNKRKDIFIFIYLFNLKKEKKTKIRVSERKVYFSVLEYHHKSNIYFTFLSLFFFCYKKEIK
jgi:hypothetical protein